MNTLFPVYPAFPEGFSYFPEFINQEEEKTLLEEISKVDLHTFIFRGYEAKRKVASFGYDYNFEDGQLKKGKAIPEGFTAVMNKVAAQAAIDPMKIAELLIIQYPPGAVINWHKDAPPFDLIAGISLLEDCTFRLHPTDKNLQVKKNVISFSVDRRSLYLMKGIARTDWQHSITPLKRERYSITFRTLK